jgi:hypothetical protein
VNIACFRVMLQMKTDCTCLFREAACLPYHVARRQINALVCVGSVHRSCTCCPYTHACVSAPYCAAHTFPVVACAYCLHANWTGCIVQRACVQARHRVSGRLPPFPAPSSRHPYTTPPLACLTQTSCALQQEVMLARPGIRSLLVQELPTKRTLCTSTGVRTPEDKPYLHNPTWRSESQRCHKRAGRCSKRAAD